MPTVTFAQEKVLGEIVNVNYDYRIAFADIDHEQLPAGEVVKIMQADEIIAYLEVIDSSDTITKLGPVSSLSIPPTFSDFSKIRVGQTVVDVYRALDATDNDKNRNATLFSSGTADEKIRVLVEDNIRVSNLILKLQDDNKYLLLKQQDTANEVKEYQKKIKALEDKNHQIIIEQQQKTATGMLTATSCDNEEVKALREKIATLRERLKYLADLVQSKVDTYEKK